MDTNPYESPKKTEPAERPSPGPWHRRAYLLGLLLIVIGAYAITDFKLGGGAIESRPGLRQAFYSVAARIGVLVPAAIALLLFICACLEFKVVTAAPTLRLRILRIGFAVATVVGLAYVIALLQR